MRAAICGLLLSLLLTIPARAEPASQPRALREVSVSEHVGALLPRGLAFTNSDGERVAFDTLVRGKLPTLLVLAYARCTMLCSWVLRGVSSGLADLSELELGRDYRFVVVSIDEREELTAAAQKRDALLARMGHDGARDRMTYLLRGGADTRALADALGFAYAWDPGSNQYAHPSVAFVLTPDARVARYLYGIQFPAPAIAEALKAARAPLVAQARSRPLSDELLRCFRFDPATRRYGPQLRAYFRAGGLVLLLVMVALLAGLYRWERRRRRTP